MFYNLTKAQWTALADGIARGRSMLTISGVVGVDRSTLRKLFARDGMLDELARRMGSPDALDGDALAVLFDEHVRGGERGKAYELRQGLAAAARGRYPEWFAARAREAEEAEAEEARRREAEAQKAEAECAREEAEHLRMLDCLLADYWNLQTLVLVQDREWREGTPCELKRGLDTPEARLQYRCVRGLRWSCAGFGPYYAPTWSAWRCRSKYGETLTDAQADDVEREVEREQNATDYRVDPFVRRDPKLPTNEAAAKSLLDHVKACGAFVGWKRNRPRGAANAVCEVE